MNWRAELTGEGRKEIPEVPLRALTEALVNSLCHRDYTNPKGNEVAIFKDRIEIYNPGQFPEDVKIENYIIGKERSILRNPLIGNTLFLSKDIERWGSGLKRIYDECNENNVKIKFEILKTGFLVIFYRKGQEIDKGVEDLSDIELILLGLIRKKRNISKKEMIKEGNLSKKAVDYNIFKLKTKGLLIRIGSDRGGHWKIVDEIKNKK